MSESKTTFGNLLRRLRCAAALSQEELAERAGLSRSGISHLERGLHPAPRFETVRLLADGLQLGNDDRAALLAAARPTLWQGHDMPAGRPLPRSVSFPRPLTRLIGREAEVAALRALLRDAAVRLVTVTGPGGVGKTRLAIEVAAGLVGAYPDGVVLVDLAPLTDPDLVVPAVAAALGVPEAGGQRRHEALGEFLIAKRLLLVLDNCERVSAVVPSLTSLLAASPGLTILATSRQPFRVRGEHEVPLPPLPLPAPNNQDGFAALTANPAVALFAERAAAVQPDFAVSAANADTIVAISRRLDGLPLAIELAAARTKLLPPAALLARLERRLPLLTGGGLDLPARQRTMRATITWSYDLLTPEEQGLFRRLALFVGGFTLEAAEAVAGPDRQCSVLDGIGALVEQSLVRPVSGSDGEPRYVMLETLREFGLGQLEEAGEVTAIQQAHAAYFVEFAERGYVYHLAPQDSVDRRYRRIEADHGNILLALATMANVGDAHGVARLAGALGLFWQLRAYLREGRSWLEWALAHGAEVPAAARCRALAGLSSIQWAQGQHEAAASTARGSLHLAEQIGDRNLVAYSIHVLGLVADSQQQWSEAEALFTRALKLWRELGVRAEEAIALDMLSGAAHGLGDHELSAAHAEAALALARELDHAYGAARSLSRLARLAGDAGDIQREASAYQEALQLYASVGNRWAISDAIAGLGGIAATQGQPDVAAKLVGAVEALIREAGSFIRNATREDCDRASTLAAAVLGEQRCAELRAAGRELRLDDAIALAASIPLPAGSPSPAEALGASAPAAGTARLTPREVEV